MGSQEIEYVVNLLRSRNVKLCKIVIKNNKKKATYSASGTEKSIAIEKAIKIIEEFGSFEYDTYKLTKDEKNQVDNILKKWEK